VSTGKPTNERYRASRPFGRATALLALLLAALLALSSYSAAASKAHVSTAHGPSITQQDVEQALTGDPADGDCDDHGTGAKADGCCMTSASCLFCAHIAAADFALCVAPQAYAMAGEVKLSSGDPEFTARPPRNS
jgi:hypothetical protein